MTHERLVPLKPTEIARTLGCSVTTASAWINASKWESKRGGPPEWQRKWFLPAFEQPAAKPARKRKQQG